MRLNFLRQSGADFIIAGLGNPGAKYEKTRHNMGFLTADIIAEMLDVKIKKLKFRSLYAQTSYKGRKLILLKPQTFMNLSGEAIREALAFYKLKPEQLIVIYDDIALDPGKIRIRRQGSDGGHNGIKNILYHIKTDIFPRVKIGVGSPPERGEMINWVTTGFPEQDLKLIYPSLKRAAEAALCIVSGGIDSAMNLYNSDPKNNGI